MLIGAKRKFALASVVFMLIAVAIIQYITNSPNDSNITHFMRKQQVKVQNYPYIASAQQSIKDYSKTKIVDAASQGSSLQFQNSSLTDIFKKVENSVVQITSKASNPNDMQTIINGNPLGSDSTRLGSGFVYDLQGHIVTNSHVVNGAKTVDVTFVDGDVYTATVIGDDPFGDIAVLQISDNFTAENAVPLIVGNSSDLQVGERIISIGNPFGLSDTMTTGIISQVGRLLPNPDTGFSIPNGIQTDAAINPGNSGGPLLNLQGQIIGINTAISSSTGEFSGIGFAIPSNAITRIVPALIQRGNYDHPWLGISGTSITPYIAQSAALPRNYKGVVIASVQPASPADKAGIQAMTQDTTSAAAGTILGSNPLSATPHIGDIIIAIDGLPVKHIDDIVNYIDMHKSVGDTVKLTVNREGHKLMDLNATLEARPSLNS